MYISTANGKGVMIVPKPALDDVCKQNNIDG